MASFNVSILFETPPEHHVTGADFDIELWILSNTKKVSLAVQAKKFIEPKNSYVSKIKYPKNSSGQINKLLAYARKEKKIPVYFLYSMPALLHKYPTL